ncbi:MULTISPECIES: YkgJ family cysteine cluster protein [Xanthomarina]|uniref:Zinc/iron-chelating domain-containing protein n=1 Tax=Xanthomarina gelatinilytica TaxID=1137281 RepID=A0A3C0F902_9FLAO|nr:YkgJ family cysteine cluster protein [Xanthomarina sp.]HAB28230.1 zinc/iron-chelating domain-containing protein [Xanthomarina gelatinilytica]MAL23742.1 zinc/iron-chelating domain-containing protein [Xanthomarina sp.]MBF62253.1 zinc/iron-chelating domain-containing protein [Xanthomarina sp.]HAI19986.1 zinc/iron-chelating domain-containing protein [Xanthomarina gelatinilytica]HCY80812.1 zinc/iron-chelating domain-containing protein [Xanthomarina gelatinilytica]
MNLEPNLESLPKLAKDKHKENKTFFTKLKKKPPKQLDYLMQELHDEAFKRTDCLDCANCCKTTGPLFTDKDIVRIAKHFKMKQQHFIDTYLRVDEDNDYVLQSVPCPFLGADNYCSIYDVRPKACSGFPHTDRKKFHQISNLTLKNVAICPAAFNIVEEMKRRIKL